MYNLVKSWCNLLRLLIYYDEKLYFQTSCSKLSSLGTKKFILSQTFPCILSNSNKVNSMVSREIEKKPYWVFQNPQLTRTCLYPNCTSNHAFTYIKHRGKCFIYIFNKITRRKQLERIRIRIRIYLCDQNVNLRNSPKHPRVFL